MGQQNAALEGDYLQFNEHAHTWWDPNGPMLMLHALNPLRYGWLEGHIGDFRGLKVLDVGCGGGLLSEAMARSGAQVTGLDLAQDLLTVARLHAEEQKLDINYVAQDVASFASQHQGEFDVVTCMEMLEHVPEPSVIVHAISQLVKPSGRVCLSTINRTPRSFVETVIGAEYVLGWLPKGTHHYSDFIRPSELERIMHNNNLRLDGMTGVKYNFFTESFELCTSAHNLYMMVATNDQGDTI